MFEGWHWSHSRDGTTKQLHLLILKRKCHGFQAFSVIGLVYLLTHLFFIEINWHVFYWYLTATVAEPFLCRHLLSNECFAESNTIFNGQTRDGSPDQLESWHDDLPTPRILDNEVSRRFNMWPRESDRFGLLDTLMKSLVSADPDCFSNIIILLVLGCTLLSHVQKQSVGFLCWDYSKTIWGFSALT